jgi:hypothetical protein
MRSSPFCRALLPLFGVSLLTGGACSSGPFPIGLVAPPSDAGMDGFVRRQVDAEGDVPASHVPDASTPDTMGVPTLIDAGTSAGSDAGGIAALAVCHAPNAWSWCNPAPTGNTLDAVWGIASDDVWAVGAGGTAEHWNGSAWSAVTTPTQFELFGVWGSGANQVWAVGSDARGTAMQVATSVILYWNGTAWGVVDTVPSAELWAVWGSGPDDVWFVGGADPGAGLLVHWDGATFTPTMSATASVLYGVSGTASTDVWVAGIQADRPDASTSPSDGSNVPEIDHFNGTSWLQYYDNGGTATTATPLSVFAVTTGDVWVGTSGSPLNWDGTSWQTIPVGTSTLGPSAFGGVGANVWGAMGDTMVQWTGSSFAMPAPVAGIDQPGETAVTLTSLCAVSDTDIWAVGDGGSLVHYDGTGWTAQEILPELTATWAVDANEAWAVGEGGTALHWTGASWAPTATGTTSTLVNVWGTSPTDVWAVTSTGGVIQWTGSSWGALSVPPPSPVVAVGGISGTDAWVSDGPASGDAGMPTVGTLSHFSGSAWTSYDVPLIDDGTAVYISAIWANATSDVWAVGYETFPGGNPSRGLAVHWDGTAWQSDTPPVQSGVSDPTAFGSVWGSGPGGTVWITGTALGASGTAAILYFNGQDWSATTLNDATGVGGIWGSDANDVWMWARLDGSANQSVLYWNGTSWTTAFTLPDTWTYGTTLGGTSATDLWLVGSGGMILHHS